MNKNFFSIRRVAALLFGTTLLATGFSACKRNQPDPIDPTVTQFTNSKTVSASISGQALDENGNPLANATVTVGTSTYQTSNDGGFFFKNITLRENAQLVKITKPGYFAGYRTLKIKAGKDHFTRIAVLKKDNAQTFDATQSKTILAANGASINFSPNTIVNKQTNQAYTGTVTIFAKTIRANDPNIAQLTPGALRGITTEGGETGLSTYGMIGVELEDGSGNALQIATGKTAEIVIPIAANQVATAPTTIPLWHFNEDKAMWVQEGTATKVGNEYKGTVSHFSYWNYDLSIPLVTMDATFLNSTNSTGLGGYVVEVISAVNGTRYGYTNGLGEAYGMVPANSTLTINLVDPMCNLVLYSTTTTTAASNFSLGTVNVTLPTVNALTVTGNVVNCANAALPNAPVSIQVGNFLMMTNSDASGNFSWSGVMCSPSATSTVAAYDVAAGVSGSINPTLIVGSNAVGAISACGTVIELFTYTLNNGSGPTTFTYMAPLSQFYTSAQGPNTYVTLQDSASGPAANSLNMDFDGTQTIGTHNINSFNHYSQGGGLMTNIKTGANPVLPVTIVQFGSTTGSYIKGNFSGSFVDAVSSSTYTVTGNFNLERDF